MRRYETFIIVQPDLSEELRLPVLERVKETVAQMGGLLVRAEEWGSRKLAYPIKKKERGYYVRFDFCGTGQIVNELERFFRIDERVLKHMSVQLDPEPDVERIKEEMARAEEEANKPAETPAAEAAADTPAETAVPAAQEPSQPAETAAPAAQEPSQPAETAEPKQEA